MRPNTSSRGLAASLAIVVATSFALAEEPAGPPNASSADGQQIQGHWVCTQRWDDGEESRDPGEIHAVATDKELKISAPGEVSVYVYKLNPETNPKRCDLNHRDEKVPIRCIYKFKDDRLTLTWAKESNDGYPDYFAPRAGQVTFVFTRVKKSEDAAGTASLSKEDTEIINEVRTWLAEQVKLVEAKKYREFLDRWIPPERRQEEKVTKYAVSDVSEHAVEIIGLLRFVAAQPVTLNTNKTKATFDLRGAHVNGLPGLRFMHLRKIGDRWYADVEQE